MSDADTREPGDLMLRPADDTDIPILMSWFDSAAARCSWGGPHFRFSSSRSEFTADTRLHELASFMLEDRAARRVAFGQWYERNGHVHLGRLAVAPSMRGRKIGARLIRALLRASREAGPFRHTSLFVYASNQPAVRCYRALGYVEADMPADAAPLDDMLFLTASIASVLGGSPDE